MITALLFSEGTAEGMIVNFGFSFLNSYAMYRSVLICFSFNQNKFNCELHSLGSKII